MKMAVSPTAMFFTECVADLEPSPTPAVRHAVIAAVTVQATAVRSMTPPSEECLGGYVCEWPSGPHTVACASVEFRNVP